MLRDFDAMLRRGNRIDRTFAGANFARRQRPERSKARALVDMLASKQDFAVHTANAGAVRVLLAKSDTAEAEGRVQDSSADTGRQIE